MREAAFILCDQFSSHKKSESIPVGTEMGFVKDTHGDTGWRSGLCFTPSQNGRSDHKFIGGT